MIKRSLTVMIVSVNTIVPMTPVKILSVQSEVLVPSSTIWKGTRPLKARVKNRHVTEAVCAAAKY